MTLVSATVNFARIRGTGSTRTVLEFANLKWELACTDLYPAVEAEDPRASANRGGVPVTHTSPETSFRRQAEKVSSKLALSIKMRLSFIEHKEKF